MIGTHTDITERHEREDALRLASTVILTMEEAVTVTNMRDDQGTPTHYVAVYSDISERKANEERMQHLAHFDVLTELPNRALFSDRLRQAIAMARRDKTRLP